MKDGTRMKTFRLCAGLILAAVIGQPALANIIGFDERFGLSDDRSIPLKELIPGTEEYYYYHALHYQHLKQFDKADEIMSAWIKRYRHSGRVRELLNRQALLEYDTKPEETLKYLRDRLGLRFNHTREDLTKKPVYSTRLDPKQASFEHLKQDAMSHYRNLDGFQQRGLEKLDAASLNPDLRRDYLKRLKRPDQPGLVDLVLADLKHKHSGGFGSLSIHKELLLPQLDELLKKDPKLLQNEQLIRAYLKKLRPGADANPDFDPDVQLAYYERAWAFASKLAPAYNSIKAHLLYNWLQFEMSQGVYNKARFMEYLKLPRNAGYVNPEYVKAVRNRKDLVQLSSDYRNCTGLPTVRTDDALVRRFLLEFLKEGDAREEFSKYVVSSYLKELYAETKIVNGIGDMESWYSLMTPGAYKALMERIDLDLLPTNPEVIKPGEPVALDVGIKNVKTLFVKTYRINTQNWYREYDRPVSTDIDLDGLVANDERTVKYDHVPVRRHVERLTFPEIKTPGVYVVELIGNGKSSRAVVRVGELRFAETRSAAGHVFRIYDSGNALLKDATLWLSGTTYKPDENGEILIPYSTRPGKESIVLTHNGFSALHSFEHLGEGYELRAGIHLEREQLLSRKKATVTVRAELRLNGQNVSIEHLENPYLMIHTTDIEGISNSKRVDDVKLVDGKEYTYTFAVPATLQNVQVSLQGKVSNLSRGEDQQLHASTALSVNGIDRGSVIEDVLLRRAASGYVLEVLGRSGEEREGFPISIEFRHLDFKRSQHVTLQTDANGRAHLGHLPDVNWLKASAGQSNKTWVLQKDRHSQTPAIHALSSDTIQVPYMSSEPGDISDLISLLEVREGTFVRDVRGLAKSGSGMLVIRGLEPGDYSLFLKDTQQNIPVRVTEGVRDGSVLLSRHRMLESHNMTPMTIGAITTSDDDKTLNIRLLNPGAYARVHVVATRYMPVMDPYGVFSLGHEPGWRAMQLNPRVTQYLAGRNIGDEYRYVLERRYADKYAGNMLARPTLLLNPWSLRKTDADKHDAEGGEAWEDEKMRAASMRAFGGGMPGKGGRGAGGLADFANLDFLPDQSVVLLDLEIGKDGMVTLPLDKVGANQSLQIIAIDRYNAATRHVALQIPEDEYLDLRQRNILKPDQHFTQQKHISLLKAGETFRLEDLTTSKMEIYDSLPKVFQLYSTLSGNATLSEFNFITGWPELKEAEKRHLYSKYACHELHYFLFKKDPAFFNTVVKPYLANKKDKTFMDDWLLGRDLNKYLKSWHYARLNVVERVLLGQRVKGEAEAAARHLKDRYDLLPPNLERFNRLFDTAIQGSALETGGSGAMLSDIQASVVDEVKDARFYALGKLSERYRRNGESDEGAVVAMAELNANFAADDPFAAPPAETAGREAKKVMNAKKEKTQRKRARQFYRKLDKTEEWVENNYYHLPIEQQVASLVRINGFWKDLAASHDKFLTRHMAEAHGNFTEMMFALSSLDLPFKAGEHKIETEGVALDFTSAGPAIVFHREIREAEKNNDPRPILVSQNFFAQNDRYRHENNERFDRFVVDKFEVRRVYGCQVVLTNPTSSRRKVDVLMQIPAGALPVQNGFFTKSRHVQVEPYSTVKQEYYFYFPVSEDFPHYPVHVAQDEKMLASAEPFVFSVVDRLDDVDKSDWPWISQYGSNEDVLKYLNSHNIDRIDVSKIAFRMKDKAYFDKILSLLDERHVYHPVLWSYGVYHNVVPVIRQYLQHNDFANQVGVHLDSPLLTVDPVIRHRYQHKEYWPLVNPRQHRLGKDYRILNQQFFAQYEQWLSYLRYRPELDSRDRIASTYYMILQDRITDALNQYGKIGGDVPLETKVQKDYFDAYLAFSQEEPDRAAKIASRYEDYPVDRWRKRFENVLNQVAEIRGEAAGVSDKEDRTQSQTRLADTAPSLDILGGEP